MSDTTAIMATAPADHSAELVEMVADVLAEPTTDDQATTGGSRTPPERVLAVQLLKAQGKNQTQICEILGMDSRTYQKLDLRQEHGDTLARLLLKGGALEHVKEWQLASKVAAAKGRHEPARDALIAAGIVEMKPQQQTNINVGIVLSGGDGPQELVSPPIQANT